jgi:hypothetical protein
MSGAIQQGLWSMEVLPCLAPRVVRNKLPAISHQLDSLGDATISWAATGKKLMDDIELLSGILADTYGRPRHSRSTSSFVSTVSIAPRIPTTVPHSSK